MTDDTEAVAWYYIRGLSFPPLGQGMSYRINCERLSALLHDVDLGDRVISGKIV